MCFSLGKPCVGNFLERNFEWCLERRLKRFFERCNRYILFGHCQVRVIDSFELLANRKNSSRTQLRGQRNIKFHFLGMTIAILVPTVGAFRASQNVLSACTLCHPCGRAGLFILRLGVAIFVVVVTFLLLQRRGLRAHIFNR